MKLHCDIQLPASKSESNRALMIAAYGGFDANFRNLSDSNDTLVLANALHDIGAFAFDDYQRYAVDKQNNVGTICVGRACSGDCKFLGNMKDVVLGIVPVDIAQSPKQDCTDYTYDKLGNKISRIETNHLTGGSEKTTWVYHTQAGRMGLLKRITSPNQTIDYEYDDLLRMTKTIDRCLSTDYSVLL